MLFTTDRFAELALITAAELDLPDIRLVSVEHPLGGTDPDVVARRGREATARLIELFTA